MPDVKVSNLGGSMNPNGTISGSMFAQSMQNPNIPYQQTWNNPSWMQQAGAWMNSDSMSQGMGMGDMSNGNMIMQADQTGGQLFGMLAGQNQSTAGDIMKSLPGMSTVGNLWNAAFGSHINEEFVAQTRSNTNALKSQIFNSNTNADVLSDWRNMVTLSHVSKDEVGSDGWFSSKAKRKTAELNRGIDAANQLASLNFRHAVDNADTNTDLRISQGTYAYGGPINSFRKYYSGGGYLAQAKALIRNNEGWSEKPYADSPKGKQWRSVGYGFNDSGFREKYPEGISKHYEHGITRKQAEEELDYFLNKAEKTLKNIYGKQWNNFTDNEKAAILDTYYQRPASVGKSSRFYKAVAAGEDAGKYLGVAGFTKRNNIRQNVFGGGQYNFANVNYSDNPDATSSSLQEETILPVVQELDLSGITPTEARALQLNLAAPSFNPSMFSTSSSQPTQQSVPTVGTVEDYLNAYDNMYAKGGHLFGNGGSWMDFFGAWNSAKGGNNYFANMGGSQWKPSDGFQINSGNGNTGDWIGQATTAVNTLSNWGSEDPTLGRGGDYSQFGMAAYDLMKTIRDATKSRRESIGQKLGIPIYANGGNLFDNGGSVGAMGYAQIGNAALKLASNAKYQAGLDPEVDEDKIQRSINRYGMSLDDDVANVNTNGDLLDLWANYSPVRGRLDMRDFRDRSLFDDFLNGYAASWEGFNAGKNFGPWGAAIGAIVGGLSSNISAIVGRNKASNAADEANEKLEKADKRLLSNLEYAAERVDKENDLRILQNMDAEYTNNAADGGKLNMGFGLRNPFIMPDGTTNPLYKAFGGGITHGTNWDTGINWVNEGGSHGENPLGGVPMGMDEQGIPNLVEEGEAIWNGDYVFSKRMKVPKKLREKYNLSDDATFADAVAKLTKDSEERPLSNIDRATNDHILGEFADTQEEMRMAKAQRAMDREIQLREDFLTGFNLGAFGGPLFSDGGGIHIDPSKKGTFKAQASKMGMGVQEAASHILANKEDYSPAMVKKAVFAHNFAHADGGNLFTNPFAYGGEMGNVFAGPGDRPNTLNLDANDQSLVRRLFGDSGFTRFMENASTALNDPLGYFAGDEIESVMNKVANMSKPQMDAFFNTKVGQAVAKAIVTLDEMPESSAQQAGVQRWMKSTGRLARPVYKAAVDAAKRSMAQSRVNARGQMRTPTPKGTRVVKETTTPAQIARNEAAAIRAQRNSTPPVLRRTTELAPVNRGTTALSNINRGATGVAATGTGATGMSPYISRPTGVGFPEQTMWNATVPFYGGLGIAAGNLLNWEDESGVDAVTGADRRPASSDVKGSNLDASITKRNPKSKETVASYRGKGNGKAVPADVDDFVPVDIQDMEIPQVVETDPEDATNFGDPEVMRNIEAGLNPDGTKPVAATDTGNGKFKPRATWMRQVPIWMSGLAALRGELTPADYTNADTIMDAAYRAGQPVSVGTEYIGDYRTRNPFDERYLMNIINQNAANTSKNIMNLSGGNRAFALTGLFNNDLIRSSALAEAARQGYLANRTDDAQVSEFNRGTNLANMQAQNTRNLALANLNSHRQQAMLSGIAQGARLRQAIKDQRDAAIYGNLSNFAQGLGDIGWENSQYNMIGGLADEDVLKYMFDKDFITTYKNRLNKKNIGEG